jgi:Tol biopolymer transport system component
VALRWLGLGLGAALAAAAAVVVLLAGHAGERARGARDAGTHPPRASARPPAPQASRADPGALHAAERDAAAALAGRLDGFVVWASNRGGNHEIYRLDLATRTLDQLTHHPHPDFLARVSPDGRRILFLRGRRESVSFREEGAWDVMLMNADGSAEERLAREGYHPTWAPDGSAVLFERGRELRRLDLASRREHVVLDAGREFPGLSDAGDFELAPDGRHLAFGLRGRFAGARGLQGRFSGAVVLDLETRSLAVLTRHQACETTWAPGGGQVVWVEGGGRGGTRLAAASPDGAGRHVLVDLPGDYSHEYFPRLAVGGRWLVWAAAAQGHEHDRADYEIFAWELGTPPERAVRLTHDPGNDQWPDLWARPAR